MTQSSPRITLQLGRFLLIQNAVEDALEGNANIHNRHLIDTRLRVLDSNWEKFQAEHDLICQEVSVELLEPSYIRNKTYERCQEFYVQGRSALLTRREELDASQSMISSELTTNRTDTTHSNKTLPRIPIPKFSGDYRAWRSFRDLFWSMVGNNKELSNVEKMHYLKTSLVGEAAQLIINLPILEESFSPAWNTLIRRFDNKRVLISAQLDKLYNLKRVHNKSAKELNAFITTVVETLGALQALDCSTQYWDPILVHHLTRLLDADTQEKWELELGTSTSYPTFSQFEEFLRGRARAWERLGYQSTEKANKARSFRSSSKQADADSRSFVATTSTASEKACCQLCKSKHYLSSCKDFLALSGQRRRRLIIQHRLCFNCMGSHLVDRCPSTRRCRKCGKRHHTLIHDCFNSDVTTSTAVKATSKDDTAPAQPTKSTTT